MNYSDILKSIDLQNASVSRRQFFRHNAMGLGAAALTSMLPKELLGAAGPRRTRALCPSLNLPLRLPTPPIRMLGCLPSTGTRWDQGFGIWSLWLA